MVQLGMIYGSLTAVVMFLLWVFFAACVFLVGAEIVRNLESGQREVGAFWAEKGGVPKLRVLNLNRTAGRPETGLLQKTPCLTAINAGMVF